MGWWRWKGHFRHNFSIIPPVEHNFEHNTLVSRVTPESLILYFFEHNPTGPRARFLVCTCLYLDLPVTSAELPLDQSLNHTICDVYTPKAAEINFNTRKMLRILFLFIVCDIHFFGFIEIGFEGNVT